MRNRFRYKFWYFLRRFSLYKVALLIPVFRETFLVVSVFNNSIAKSNYALLNFFGRPSIKSGFCLADALP
jgi:hypothetical protein